MEADPCDIELAHQGQISTNELSRRASKAMKRRAAESSEAAQRKRAQMGSEGARTILKWLASDPATAFNAEQIIEEARFQSKLSEEFKGLPEDALPIHLTQAEVIERLRPTPDVNELDIAFFAQWLALWTLHLFPSWAVRWTALDRALSVVSKLS